MPPPEGCPPGPMSCWWRVVSNGDNGGIFVRRGKELSSAVQDIKLANGAVVKEIEIDGDELHFVKRNGQGPVEGWVSIKVDGKAVLLRWRSPEDVGANMLCALRSQPPRLLGTISGSLEESVKQAARAIMEADALLIGTGAGMGVDSGLGTFRGRNAGIWPPLQRLGLDFPQVSTPNWFRDDPHFAWAFWKFRYDAYTGCDPHTGYWVLADWGRRLPRGYFSFTSNIDGHWEQVGAPTLECHGSLRFMQCVQGSVCNKAIWPVPRDFALQLQDGKDDRVKDPLPCCPKCGGVARPAVLMFGDWGYCSPREGEQKKRYEAFLARAKLERLVVLEVGAGSSVPTVRACCERQGRRPGAQLIRINLEDATVPKGGISIQMGALDAISLLDEQLRKMGWVEKPSKAPLITSL